MLQHCKQTAKAIYKTAKAVYYNYIERKPTMNTPNWQKHSKKAKKTRGTCKAVLKARKQSLKALKARIAA
jgi:hypothetical protein